jgi:hypothetical protein
LQAVLNTLTEHDFHAVFKNDRSAGNSVHSRKGTTSSVKVANRQKLVFTQMAAPVLEMMHDSFYNNVNFLTTHCAMKTYRGMDVQIHVFLISAVFGGESAPGTHCLWDWMGPRASLYSMEKW